MRNVLFFLWAYICFACEQKPQANLPASSDTTNSKSSPVLTSESSMEAKVKANNEEFIIDIDQVGNIKKGIAARQLYDLIDSTSISKEIIRNERGAILHTYTIYTDTKMPAIICEASRYDTILNILIQSPVYKTTRGIGVGSTFAQLSKVYHVAEVYANKTNRVFARVEELQQKHIIQGAEQITYIQFELSINPIGLTDQNRKILVSAIPPDVKITAILL